VTSPSRVLAITAIINAIEKYGVEPPDHAASWKDYAEYRAGVLFGRPHLGQLTDEQADTLIQAMDGYRHQLEQQEEIEF
jgi:hypothetical protein